MRKYLGALLLSSALLAPTVMFAEDEHHDSDRDHRYYDRSYKDYHQWNENEDRAYRRWLGENHREYRDFSRASRRDQDNYWRWRHNHNDNDHR